MTTSKPSAIEGIDGITYSTDRWDDARRFFTDWGLKAVSDDAGCQVWETLNGARVQVRRPDDARLPPPMEAGPTMREVAWGVTDAAALEPIARALQGVAGFEDRRAVDGTLVALDPHGLRISFQVSKKRPVDVAGVPTNAWGGVRRIDTPSPIYDHAEPVEIGHVVFFTDRLDQMEEILEDLSSSLNGGQQMAAMIDTPGVTLRHVGGLFAAAAEFYQKRPWRSVPGDVVIEIRCDKFQAARWYAVVMGQSGMTYGLAMYEDREVLQAFLREDPDAQRRNSGMSLMYSEAFEISVRDLDAAEREGWPVAGPEAYPLVLRINPGLAIRPPLAWEMEILEGCLRAVPPFLARTERMPARMTVPVATGELTLELTWVG